MRRILKKGRRKERKRRKQRRAVMQSYPPRVSNRRLQEDWARAAKEGSRVLMNLKVDFLAHGPRLGPLLFVNIRIGFFSFGPCILAILVV